MEAVHRPAVVGAQRGQDGPIGDVEGVDDAHGHRADQLEKLVQSATEKLKVLGLENKWY